jgi:hypothetical protein
VSDPLDALDPLDRLGLRDSAAAVRAEWRVDEEEWTRAVFELWQHDRTLLDVLRECMHRGDTVALELPDVTITGALGAVGDDFVGLHGYEGPVDVPVGPGHWLVARAVEHARSCGTRGEAVSTFRARLLVLESHDRAVVVPLAGLAWVRSTPDTRPARRGTGGTGFAPRAPSGAGTPRGPAAAPPPWPR